MKCCEGEIKLGRSILDKALLDSFDSQEDYDFFNPECEHFSVICFISDMDTEDVYKKFLKVHERYEQKDG